MMLKKGIQVKVTVGKDKGKTGEVIEINRKDNMIKVKAINMLKKHQKPKKTNKMLRKSRKREIELCTTI